MRLPFVIRQSTIVQAQCLYRAHQTQVLGVKEPTSEFAARGTDFHAMAKYYVDHLVASKQETDWEYADRITSGDGTYWNDDAVQIFNDWSRNTSVDPAVVFSTEYKIRLDADLKPCDQANAAFSGDLDRLEIAGNLAVIHDYKTNWAISNPLTAQSIFYPWLLWKIMPHLDRITFRLEFVRYNVERERVFTRDDLERMDRWVDGQLRRIVAAANANDWPAEVNSGCTFCRLECPLVKAGMSPQQLGRIESPDQARAIGGQLYALKRAASQLQAALRPYAVENGPIDLGNQISLGFKKQTQTEYDPRTILRLNEEHGFKPTRALHVTSKEVSKIGRQYPEYAANARAASSDSSKTVFKFTNESGDPLGEDEEEID
jgi:hypothetical protein